MSTDNNFQWNDLTVAEFAKNLAGDIRLTTIIHKLDIFKASKQKKKEWEIIEFLRNGDVFKLMDWQKYRCYTQPTFETTFGQISLEWALDGKNGCKIHSVRRLSDGEVFTVGDKVRVQPESGNWHREYDILYFQANGNKMKVCSDQYTYFIEDLHKAKQPLFTTEDGKVIHIGDNYWVWDFGELNNTPNEIHPVANASQTHKGDGVNRRYFSTKEAAEEYILLNKPCLSVSDVIERISDAFDTDCFNTSKGELFSHIKRLAKSKLK
jgi:hypothetical protein